MPTKKDDNVQIFLKEAVSNIVGKQAEEIVNFLEGSKYVNEFLIAKKLNNTINQTRNILYRLSDHGIVSSIRKKDKRKGWYTYFWKIEVIKALEFLRENLQKRLDQIKNQIDSREVKRFYICERCNIEYNEENALFMDFTCNECGNVFVLKDNTKVLKELRKNYEKFSNDMSQIETELDSEKGKSDKRKIREVQKEEKEKKRKRDEKRAATKKATEKAKKEAEKTAKKAPKKAAKKTSKKTTKKATKKSSSKKPVKKAAKKK